MGRILAAPVETRRDGAASRWTFKVVAVYVYRAGLDDVAVHAVCCSRWSGATRAFFHDFDDILGHRSMSFVPRLVAAEGRRLRADSEHRRRRARSWKSRRVSRAIHSPVAGGLSPGDKGHSKVIAAGRTVTEDEFKLI